MNRNYEEFTLPSEKQHNISGMSLRCIAFFTTDNFTHIYSLKPLTVLLTPPGLGYELFTWRTGRWDQINYMRFKLFHVRFQCRQTFNRMWSCVNSNEMWFTCGIFANSFLYTYIARSWCSTVDVHALSYWPRRCHLETSRSFTHLPDLYTE